LRFSPAAALSAAVLTLLLAGAPRAAAMEAWIAEARTAPEVVPPFQRKLYAGEVIRIRVLRSSALRLTFGIETRGGLAVVAPVKNGQQIEEKRIIQEYSEIFTYSFEEADYVALRVVTGFVALEADLAPMREEFVGEGQQVSFRIEPYMEVRGRFVNANDFRSTVSYEFRKDGKDISRSAPIDRTLVLNFRNSASEKLWSTVGDELIVTVKRGRVVVKAGQPFDVIDE
jgi:formylmethanofuran dehydrogenase subunit D